MCFCLNTGECFEGTGENSIVVWPWQGMPYLFLSNPDDVYTGDQGTILSAIDFYDADGNPNPVTEENRVLMSVNCGACPAPSSCNT